MLKTLSRPRRRQIPIGPQDQGKPMSLMNFDKAVPQEGYCYELGKGTVEVSDVPHPEHFAQVQEIRDQFAIASSAKSRINSFRDEIQRQQNPR